jgi:hypothetical protein
VLNLKNREVLGNGHKQIPIEVKGSGEYYVNGIPMAMIDEDICDLVHYLNAIPEVQTIESCQGFKTNYVWIDMIITGDIMGVTKRIYDVIKDIGLMISLNIEYCSSCMSFDDERHSVFPVDEPSVILEFPRECLEEVTEAIKNLSDKEEVEI